MSIWEIIFIVAAIILYIWFERFKSENEKKFKLNIPIFTPQQRNEFLDRNGPKNVQEALQIHEGGYNFHWNNVLKAASLLGDAKGEEVPIAVKHLITNLESDEPNIVAISAVSLGKLKDVSAVPHLKKHINSQPSQVQLARVKSLELEKSQREAYAKRIGASITNSRTIPDLNEKHKMIREAVAWAINEIDNSVKEQNIRINSSQTINIEEAFTILNNSSQFIKEKQIQALAVLSNAKGNDIPKANKILVQNLINTDNNIVLISIISLGKIGEFTAINDLNRLFQDTPAENVLLRNTISDSIDAIFRRGQ
ncbi:MAG: HEAT repeat domain-containing protein [Bacteroidota bacterium]